MSERPHEADFSAGPCMLSLHPATAGMGVLYCTKVEHETNYCKDLLLEEMLQSMSLVLFSKILECVRSKASVIVHRLHQSNLSKSRVSLV